MDAFFRRGIARLPHELLIELPTLNTWPVLLRGREFIAGNEIAGNGFLAMKRNSPMHQRKSLYVKLANMSGFLAVADGGTYGIQKSRNGSRCSDCDRYKMQSVIFHTTLAGLGL